MLFGPFGGEASVRRLFLRLLVEILEHHMKPTSVEHLSDAIKGAVSERKASRFSRASRRSRGRPTFEVSLPSAVVDALHSRCERTGESRSSVVETALRTILEIGEST